MNLLGYLSIAFGALGSICCCCPGLPFVGGIPAVILGYLHLQRVKKGEATMAWLGWVGIALGVLALIIGIFSLTTGLSDRFQDQYDRQFDGT